MCTATWRLDASGYDLFFNRDERHSRGKAHPPRIAVTRGVSWVAPVDPDFGGTWIAVNDRGVAVGLLNGWSGRGRGEDRDFRSRGLLVVDLAPSRGVGEVADRLRSEDLARYRDFRLLVLAPAEPPRAWEWAGEELGESSGAGVPAPLLSSAFDEQEVGRRRRAEFRSRVSATGAPTSDELGAYHRSHGDAPSAYSVCMHRDDAGTQSLTRVRVDAERVEMIYHPGAPCRDAAEARLSLERRVAS